MSRSLLLHVGYFGLNRFNVMVGALGGAVVKETQRVFANTHLVAALSWF